MISSIKAGNQSHFTKNNNIPKSKAGKEQNHLKNNKAKLEDYQLRRTLTKKSEKVEIDCQKSFDRPDQNNKSTYNIDDKLSNMIDDIVKIEYSELINFLNSIDMIKYFESFQKNLIDDLATILGKVKCLPRNTGFPFGRDENQSRR